MSSTGRFSFTTTHGMIHRVHGNTPNLGTPAPPSVGPGFTQRNVFMVEIPNLSHRCPTADMHPANLTRGQLDLGILTLLGHELRGGTGAACQLSPFSRSQLDVVNDRSKGNVNEWQTVSSHNIDAAPGHDRIAGTYSLGCQNVAFFPIHVVKTRQVCAAIGIVLNSRHDGRNPVLVPSKIKDSKATFVPSASTPHADVSIAISSADAFLSAGQAPERPDFRQILPSLHASEARARRSWLVLSDSHLNPFKEFDGSLPRFQRHVSLLPGRASSLVATLSFDFA